MLRSSSTRAIVLAKYLSPNTPRGAALPRKQRLLLKYGCSAAKAKERRLFAAPAGGAINLAAPRPAVLGEDRGDWGGA